MNASNSQGKKPDSTVKNGKKQSGIVYLIGAGPGDPGLLTIRGAELLSRSDVVLYDGLSNVELLRHAPTAQHICVGKHGRTRIWKQDEIIAETLRHASAGNRVARLKGGDPAVFARTSEEVDALRAADMPFEIVPGITAALAAGSYAGIPVTHRGLASAVALVTGHEEPGKPESALDWKALAAFPGTLVIYMGVTTAPTWVSALLNAGKSPDTPTAIIRRCSHGDQQKFQCRLDEVASMLGPGSAIRPPAISIIGPVTELADNMDWFSRRPLFGQTVMVTRPSGQASEFAQQLRDQGAEVLLQPMVEIASITDTEPLDSAIERLSEFDVIVFCSRNGVAAFCDRLFDCGRDARAFADVKIATVGSKTASQLRDYFLAADITPEQFSGGAVATAIAASNSGHGTPKNALVIRASRGKDDVENGLRSSGLNVESVVAYENRDVAEISETTRTAIQQQRVDWITVTSSATAHNLHRLLGEQLQRIKLASLSAVTGKTLRALGYPPTAQATEATMESLTQAIIEHETHSRL